MEFKDNDTEDERELKLRVLRIYSKRREARNAGCRTSSEADRYLEQKRKREAEENARRARESGEVGPSC
ncbi:hypothetical protein RchiOBHm_Chr1g0367461 [Rosa chinensis]|uniref:Uncharacterized protein n=1 Tax=Rosa chinensis TaxID=74649 RepID=A0A2P6SKI5_ROSCH|nr:hypothetical protein RchiOBHm_Chr1g0367461 [Rosa chinensis]